MKFINNIKNWFLGKRVFQDGNLFY